MLSDDQRAFRKRISALAQRIAPDYGIDWRLMAAAAILESGWGASTLARRAHNLFGIRAVPSTPDGEVCEIATPNGPARFRRYDNDADACHAYGRLIATSRHYARARGLLERDRELMERAVLERFVERIAPIYCPDDPGYAEKIRQIIGLVEDAAA